MHAKCICERLSGGSVRGSPVGTRRIVVREPCHPSYAPKIMLGCNFRLNDFNVILYSRNDLCHITLLFKSKVYKDLCYVLFFIIISLLIVYIIGWIIGLGI